MKTWMLAKEITGVEKIDAFKTSDGLLFQDEAQANGHQLLTNRDAAIASMVTDFDMPRADAETITRFLQANFDKVKEIVDEFTEAKAE